MTKLPGIQRVLWTLALLGLGVYLVSLAGRPAGALLPWADVWLANLVLATLAALTWRVREPNTPGITATGWLAIAMGTYTVGNFAYYVQAQLGWTVSPSSLADIGYLGFYPAVLFALLSLQRSSGQGLRLESSLLLDVVISALGTATLAALLFSELLHEASHATSSWMLYWVGLAYPVGDLLLIGCVAAALAGSAGHRTPGLSWIVAGLLAFTLGDYLYATRLITNTYVPGQPVDATWMVGCTIMAWGAARLERPTRTASLYPTWLLPFSGTLLAIGVLLFALDPDSQAPARWLAALTLVVSLLRWALGYRHLEQMAQLQQQATTDDLTGLLNRRAFFGEAELLFPERPLGRPDTVALLDLDGLKTVNDSLGHAAGNELLVRAADSMRAAAGPDALVARLGGDEFVIALPGVDTRDDGQVATALGATIMRLGAGSSAVPVLRLSVGVAFYPADAVNADELLKLADERMYRMKSANHSQNQGDLSPRGVRRRPH